jgi:hypothetical protein
MSLIQTTRAPLRTSSAPRWCSLQFGNLWYKKLTHQICLYCEPDRLWDFFFVVEVGPWHRVNMVTLNMRSAGSTQNVRNHARNYTAWNLDHTVNSAGLSVGLSFTWCTVKQFSDKQNWKSHHSSSVPSQCILTTLCCIYLCIFHCCTSSRIVREVFLVCCIRALNLRGSQFKFRPDE